MRYSFGFILTSSAAAVNYGASPIVAKEGQIISKPQLATKIDVGKRMPSFKVLNHADARPWHLQELLKSNGRWRVIVFPGRLTESSNMQRMQMLGKRVEGPDSFVRRYTPPGQSIDSVIEILTVHPGPRADIELLDIPDAFHPYHSDIGWDYWKVYVDEESYHEGHGQAYANYGIDLNRGASVIVRPDQYVSWVGEMDDYEEMSRFFAGFMRQQFASKGAVDGVGSSSPMTRL